MNKLKLYYQILKNMGWDYVQFRVFYVLRNKLGILKTQFPSSPPVKSYLSLKEWKALDVPFFFKSKEALNFDKNPNIELEKRFTDFLEGKLWYFNALQYNIGKEYDWLTNPENNYKYDISKHWSEIADLSQVAGDMKFVWEKSRFSYIYDIIRYDYHFDKDCSELVFSEIDSWIVANPINQGPNYKCSQEISLRTLNWLFALHYYKNSPALTEVRFNKILHVIYWQIKHDYANINFSRKTVRNNHAITECLMLYLGGVLLPFFSESAVWKTNGKKWFEEEIAYQVYEDGTFLQFSHNYHRVLVQLLTWAFYLAEANNEVFSDVVYEKAKKTLSYLYQCQELSNGHLPNYGANDGALFFRLNNCSYRDYRPQLNALFYFFNQEHLYEQGEWTEDIKWYNPSKTITIPRKFDLKQSEIAVYKEGGIYTMRHNNSFTFIKCASYKDRPSHADNLHLDIWQDGENILRDAGTYKYNTEVELVRYFAGTQGHNTVMLGDNDQMKRGPRFIWLNWNKESNAQLKTKGQSLVFEGQVKEFKHISPHVSHTRQVIFDKETNTWEITDTCDHKTDLALIQNWHISDNFLEKFEIKAQNTEGVEITQQHKKCYHSSHYGVKASSDIIFFETHAKSIKTIIRAK